MDGFFRKYFDENNDFLLQNNILFKMKTLFTTLKFERNIYIFTFSFIFSIIGLLYCLILIYLIFKNRKNEIIKK